MITFMITLTLTASGVIVEDRALLGLGEAAMLECMAQKRQHEFTRFPPSDAAGIKFVCVSLVGEEV